MVAYPDCLTRPHIILTVITIFGNWRDLAITVQFSSVRFLDRSDRRGGGGHEGRFSRDDLPVFSAEGPCEQLWHGQGCPLFDIVHPAFPLPTTASPTLLSATDTTVNWLKLDCVTDPLWFCLAEWTRQ